MQMTEIQDWNGKLKVCASCVHSCEEHAGIRRLSLRDRNLKISWIHHCMAMERALCIYTGMARFYASCQLVKRWAHPLPFLLPAGSMSMCKQRGKHLLCCCGYVGKETNSHFHQKWKEKIWAFQQAKPRCNIQFKIPLYCIGYEGEYICIKLYIYYYFPFKIRKGERWSGPSWICSSLCDANACNQYSDTCPHVCRKKHSCCLLCAQTRTFCSLLILAQRHNSLKFPTLLCEKTSWGRQFTLGRRCCGNLLLEWFTTEEQGNLLCNYLV